jgi:hypothetical protein
MNQNNQYDSLQFHNSSCDPMIIWYDIFIAITSTKLNATIKHLISYILKSIYLRMT